MKATECRLSPYKPYISRLGWSYNQLDVQKLGVACGWYLILIPNPSASLVPIPQPQSSPNEREKERGHHWKQDGFVHKIRMLYFCCIKSDCIENAILKDPYTT